MLRTTVSCAVDGGRTLDISKERTCYSFFVKVVPHLAVRLMCCRCFNEFDETSIDLLFQLLLRDCMSVQNETQGFVMQTGACHNCHFHCKVRRLGTDTP